jgi:peptide deformylase
MKKILTIENNEQDLRKKNDRIYNLKKTKKIIKEMEEVLISDNNAIGLAAPQIGIHKRIISFKEYNYNDDTEEYTLKNIIHLINPVIIKEYGKTNGYEGCLSVPNINAFIERAERIVVKDENGMYNFKSMPAIVVQHEIDHLDGILIIDKATKIETKEE